jgi:hypothetical protein
MGTRQSASEYLSKPLRINHFASVSRPQNTLCLTWGAHSFSRNDSSPPVNPSLRPQLRNWPHFRHFRVSPFRADSCLNGQPCAPATFAGGRFSPAPEGNQELVNSIARVVQPEAGRSETARRMCFADTAERRVDPVHQTASRPRSGERRGWSRANRAACLRTCAGKKSSHARFATPRSIRSSRVQPKNRANYLDLFLDFRHAANSPTQ